jgi:hypothetical protein
MNDHLFPPVLAENEMVLVAKISITSNLCTNKTSKDIENAYNSKAKQKRPRHGDHSFAAATLH